MRSIDKQNRRQGMALMLVIVMMATASVMAYAMLANSAVQVAGAASRAAQAEADALAESGINLAMYYLQHSKHAPSLVAASGNIPTYWPGANNISFANASGTVNVSVAPWGTLGNIWTITSTGSITGTTGTVTKTISATATVNGIFQVNGGFVINGGLLMIANMFITSTGTAISTNGVATLVLLSHVTGNIAATSVANLGGSFTGRTVTAPKTNPVPTVSLLRSYSTYTYLGKTYSAQTYTGGSVGTSLTNPAGIYIAPAGDVTLNGATISGTLVVPQGNLLCNGSTSISQPISGFPAVVVSGALVPGLLSNVNINGLAYLGNGIGTSAVSNLTVTGAVVMNAGWSATYLGTLHVNYNAATASAPDLTSAGAYTTPQSVKITSWNP